MGARQAKYTGHHSLQHIYSSSSSSSSSSSRMIDCCLWHPTGSVQGRVLSMSVLL
jgi:hypothetical protein